MERFMQKEIATRYRDSDCEAPRAGRHDAEEAMPWTRLGHTRVRFPCPMNCRAVLLSVESKALGDFVFIERGT